MKIIYLLLISLLLTNNAQGAAMTQKDLIPRKILFGNPDKAGVKLSPDGKYISFLAPYQGVLNIWLQDTDLKKAATVLTEVKSRPIASYEWSYDNNHIIYSYDEGGNENYFLFKVDINTKKSTKIFADKNVRVDLAKLSYKYPNEVIIASNKQDPEIFDLYKLNIKDGTLAMFFDNIKERFADFEIDDDFNLRFGSKLNDETDFVVYKSENDKWFESFRVPYRNSTNTNILTILNDNTGYMIDSRSGNFSKLYKFNPSTLEQELITGCDKADITGAFFNRKKKLHAAFYEYDKPHWLSISDDFKNFEKIKDNYSQFKDESYSIISTDLADDFWLLALFPGNKPHSYYLYNKNERIISHLFSSNSELSKYEFSTVRPVEIKSRDGLTLMSYLTLPKSIAKDSVQKQPIPMILLVHGGPIARDSYGFTSTTQWLADRGYAVLQVNYRGSTGFGCDFFEKSNGQWAKAMHIDLIDAVNWAVGAKIADPEKIAIYGGSYGGYATLLGLTITPNVFACGVDIVGMSNLLTKIKTMPPYWRPFKNIIYKRLGASDETEEGRAYIKSISPLTYVDNIKKPLLIGQGANDPRVNVNESEQIVEAMRSKKIPVTYILYPDEGHGFAKPANRQSFNAITEEFLHKNLGGKLEPRTDEDFKDSSMIEKNY